MKNIISYNPISSIEVVLNYNNYPSKTIVLKTDNLYTFVTKGDNNVIDTFMCRFIDATPFMGKAGIVLRPDFLLKIDRSEINLGMITECPVYSLLDVFDYNENNLPIIIDKDKYKNHLKNNNKDLGISLKIIFNDDKSDNGTKTVYVIENNMYKITYMKNEKPITKEHRVDSIILNSVESFVIVIDTSTKCNFSKQEIKETDILDIDYINE